MKYTSSLLIFQTSLLVIIISKSYTSYSIVQLPGYNYNYKVELSSFTADIHQSLTTATAVTREEATALIWYDPAGTSVNSTVPEDPFTVSNENNKT